jgi:hypothetical protein
MLLNPLSATQSKLKSIFNDRFEVWDDDSFKNKLPFFDKCDKT